MIKTAALFLFAFFLSLPVSAGLNVTSGTGEHTHSDANTGGSTLTGATLSGATLSGGAATLNTSWLRPSSDTDTVRVRAFSATQSNVIFNVQSFDGATTYFYVSAAGAANVAGTLSSTKACDAGFTRKSPNSCFDTPPEPSLTALVRDTCTAITEPTGATGVDFFIELDVNSGNALALRNSTITAFSDSGCTTAITSITSTVREQTAVAAGTALGTRTDRFYVPASAIWLRFTDDAGNQGAAWFSIYGYTD